MPSGDKGVLGSGFSLVVRHQRILWWIFAVNLVLGGLGASSTARVLGSALHHSLAGQKLTNTFDVGMFLELVKQPDVKLFSQSDGVLLFACLYFLFLLFITPGVISAYLEDRALATGEYFGAAGTFFWAFVRLALWSLIPFIVVNLLYDGMDHLADYIGDRAVADQAGFYILIIGCIPVLLLFVWVRLWFDLAQVRAVSLNELKTRRDVGRSFGMALRRAWHVYRSYILISVLIWIVTAIALLIWTKVPGRAVPLTFLLLEVIMLAHIVGRLWQKACTTTWYRLNPEPVAAVVGPVPLEPVMPPPPILEAGPISDVDAPLSPEIEGVPEDGTRNPKPLP